MKTVSPGEGDPRKIAEVVHLLVNGGSNAKGLVTLADGTTVTVVNSPVINAESRIYLMEQTANAAAAKYASPYCLVTAFKGSFSIAHANNAQTDRTFLWIAVGG